MSNETSGGYFGLSNMWNSKPDAMKPQSGFWDKIDATGIFFLRFSVILWIISLIISVLSWIMIRDISNKLTNKRERTKLLDTATETETTQ